MHNLRVSSLYPLCYRLLTSIHSAKKAANPTLNIQVHFRGNLTTMRRHISRDRTRHHFNVYEQRCNEKNIRVHKTARPLIDNESIAKEAATPVSGPLDKFFALPWSKVEFREYLENFIAEANVVTTFTLNSSFHELIIVHRPQKFFETKLL